MATTWGRRLYFPPSSTRTVDHRPFAVPREGPYQAPDREAQRQVEALDIDCVFSEPQYNPELVRSVFGDMPVDTSVVSDPLGVEHAPGPDLCAGVIRELAQGVARCAEE
ncbi:hypothetical protein ACFPTY_05020 [Halomonas beimenensis]|uniref:Periplasmic solute binding protein n=1 Tax=Halomonas beimenensis TaxID=475662 RepID=A0A291P610_9GAMM|nr:hypothetical protein [Halomonas beimenensis]ATJ82326.1 periplasmic solute binding protein [Halomonas beimenensis]